MVIGCLPFKLKGYVAAYNKLYNKLYVISGTFAGVLLTTPVNKISMDVSSDETNTYIQVGGILTSMTLELWHRSILYYFVY